MASWAKKNKILLDSETCNFTDDWKMKYLFILPTPPNSKPAHYLLCNECVSAVQEYNLKQHLTTKHADFEILYTEGSVATKSKVESCYS